MEDKQIELSGGLGAICSKSVNMTQPQQYANIRAWYWNRYLHSAVLQRAPAAPILERGTLPQQTEHGVISETRKKIKPSP
jgi:hypothetical protein